MRTAIHLTILLALAIASTTCASDNWPQFRGPGALGVAEGGDLPASWSATSNVLWTQDLPGRGWSSPIIYGNLVFVTTAVSEGESEEPKKGLYFGGNRLKPLSFTHHWKVICLDLNTGAIRWEKTAHSGTPERSLHIKNSYASETPVTDGRHVYAYFGNVGIYCFTLEGEPVWTKKWPARATRYEWGTAASPVLFQDRLYVVNDNEDYSFLVAMDKSTGAEVWRVERDEKSNWATPFIWENELRTEIITPGTGKCRSYDLEGNLLYEFGGCSSITIGTPYSVFGLLYVSSGYILDQRKPIFAIRPGASGDISLNDDETANTYVAWCQKQAAPYNPTTLVYEDLLYVLLDRGFVACYDAVTGQQVYTKQRLPKGRAFTSSPWAYDGNLYCLNEDGVTFVVRAGREFKLLHTNPLGDDDMCMATPAMSNSKLLIRTATRLYCISDS